MNANRCAYRGRWPKHVQKFIQWDSCKWCYINETYKALTSHLNRLFILIIGFSVLYEKYVEI